MRMVQIIATVLGLIESTCIMEEIKVTFATASTGQVPHCDQLK